MNNVNNTTILFGADDIELEFVDLSSEDIATEQVNNNDIQVDFSENINREFNENPLFDTILDNTVKSSIKNLNNDKSNTTNEKRKTGVELNKSVLGGVKKSENKVGFGKESFDANILGSPFKGNLKSESNFDSEKSGLSSIYNNGEVSATVSVVADDFLNDIDVEFISDFDESINNEVFVENFNKSITNKADDTAVIEDKADGVEIKEDKVEEDKLQKRPVYNTTKLKPYKDKAFLDSTLYNKDFQVDLFGDKPILFRDTEAFANFIKNRIEEQKEDSVVEELPETEAVAEVGEIAETEIKESADEESVVSEESNTEQADAISQEEIIEEDSVQQPAKQKKTGVNLKKNAPNQQTQPLNPKTLLMGYQNNAMPNQQLQNQQYQMYGASSPYYMNQQYQQNSGKTDEWGNIWNVVDKAKNTLKGYKQVQNPNQNQNQNQNQGFKLRIGDTVTPYTNNKIDVNDVVITEKDIDMYEQRRDRRFKLIMSVITIAVIAATLLGIFFLVSNYKSKANNMVQGVSNSGAILWLNSFKNKDFSACDSVIEDESDKILTFDLNEYMSDDTYYLNTMNAIADSINNIDILNSKTKNGKTVYNVRVSYNKFNVLTKLKASDEVKEEFKDIHDKYESGKIDITTAEERYRQLHHEIFDENCLVSSDEEGIMNLALYEERNEDGNTYVSGVDNFIDIIIEDSNVKSNIKVFQKGIEDFTNKNIEG